jgi:hypothetical protein
MVDDSTMYVRATPARLATALRLAKQCLEEDRGHRWTQQDEDWYVSVVRDYVARDDRWISAWDMSVYIFAMFRDADRNLD